MKKLLKLSSAINYIKDTLRRITIPQGEYVRTGLTPGYYDTDELLLHTCFTLLVDFVEVELPATASPAGNGSPRSATEVLSLIIKEAAEHSPDEAACWTELNNLYQWWTKERPSRPNPDDSSGLFLFCEALLSKTRGRSFFDLVKSGDIDAGEKRELAELVEKSDRVYREYANEDEEMLHRLVKVRSFMWT